MIMDQCEIDWWILIDHFSLLITCIATVALAIFAWKALLGWHVQKKYDIIIDNLALAKDSLTYIEYMRKILFSVNEISEKYENAAKKSVGESNSMGGITLYVYLSRRDNLKHIFDKIILANSQNWATSGDTGKFTMFFERILEIDSKIYSAHMTLGMAQQSDDNEYYNKIRKETSEIIYNSDKEDDFVKEIKIKLTDLENIYRNQLPKI